MTAEIETARKEPFTRGMLIRIAITGLCLFALVNIAYGLLSFAGNGQLPTLYNVVIPGRVRFMKDYEYDPYRMLRDHAVAQAQPDTFNIAILGSSEIWGSRVGPVDSIPVIMDTFGMTTA